MVNAALPTFLFPTPHLFLAWLQLLVGSAKQKWFPPSRAQQRNSRHGEVLASLYFPCGKYKQYWEICVVAPSRCFGLFPAQERTAGTYREYMDQSIDRSSTPQKALASRHDTSDAADVGSILRALFPSTTTMSRLGSAPCLSLSCVLETKA